MPWLALSVDSELLELLFHLPLTLPHQCTCQRPHDGSRQGPTGRARRARVDLWSELQLGSVAARFNGREGGELERMPGRSMRGQLWAAYRQHAIGPTYGIHAITCPTTADRQDDWRLLPPKKTAWGTVVDEGWWQVCLRARDDERVSVFLRGRFTKVRPRSRARISPDDQNYPNQSPTLNLVEPNNLSAEHVKLLGRLLGEQAKAKLGMPMIYEVCVPL